MGQSDSEGISTLLSAVLIQGMRVTDGQTEGKIDAIAASYTRYSIYDVGCKKCEVFILRHSVIFSQVFWPRHYDTEAKNGCICARCYCQPHQTLSLYFIDHLSIGVKRLSSPKHTVTAVHRDDLCGLNIVSALRVVFSLISRIYGTQFDAKIDFCIFVNI